MSSMDLHFHLLQQPMLPEAVAIVCAPKHDDVRYFSLTPYYGLTFVWDNKGIGFQNHASLKELYEECKHIQLIDRQVEVFDLR